MCQRLFTKIFKDRLRKNMAERGTNISESDLNRMMDISIDAKVEIVSLPNSI